MPEYQAQLQQALALLHSGSAQEAFQTFRPVLSYPGLVEQPAEFAEALHAFAEISLPIAGEEFADVLRTAAQTPTDGEHLYQVGYELIEQGLGDLAATVLAFAHRLEPDNVAVLNELSAALETQMRYAEARRFLHQAPHLVEHHFLTGYLLAFTSLMCGDLETPRQLLPALRRFQADHAAFPEMTARIAAQLARADALKGHTPLDTHDLRGWHLVLTGGLLLHPSPYGFDEPMHGRYAWVQDSYGLCLLGIQRVQAVLDAVQLHPPRVWLLPDRHSQILAYATARVLDLPLAPWPVGGSQEPGLIVAYDLSRLDEDTLVSLHPHRPGQILWSHATCWTEDQPIAADLTTFLYQMNIAPWGEQLTIDPQSHQAAPRPADERDPTLIAADLIGAHPFEESVPEDEAGLLALTRAAAVAGASVLAFVCPEGPRLRQWAGSPVPGNVFR